MLEGETTQAVAARVYRLANATDFVAAFNAALDSGDEVESSNEIVAETLQFLNVQRSNTPDGLLDSVFRLHPDYSTWREGRFNTASFPAFYSALERETTEAEIRHNIITYNMVDEGGIVYYQRLECNLGDVAFDLRHLVERFPFLIAAKDGWPQCQALAIEAIGRGAGALLTYSARSSLGTNVPVFRREALSAANVTEAVGFQMKGGSIEIVTSS